MGISFFLGEIISILQTHFCNNLHPCSIHWMGLSSCTATSFLSISSRAKRSNFKPIWICFWNSQPHCLYICANIWHIWVKNWLKNLILRWIFLSRIYWLGIWTITIRKLNMDVYRSILCLKISKWSGRCSSLGSLFGYFTQIVSR